MAGYSVDLRQRVVAAVDGGMTQERASVVFCVSVNSIQRWIARRRATGSLAATVQRHGPAPAKRQALCVWLPARLDAAADATLAEHADAAAQQLGLVVSLATLSRAIAALPPGDDPAMALTPTGRARGPGRPLKQRP